MDDFFSEKHAVIVVPEKECQACGCNFQPETKWAERCRECKMLNRPKIKKIINTEFNGFLPPPTNIRLYTVPKGNSFDSYPSVTTVIHPTGIDFPNIEEYGARGSLVHKKIEIYLETQKWLTTKELWERGDKKDQEDILTMKNGVLGLKVEDTDFRGFVERYGHFFTFGEREKLLINHEHRYAGRTDCIGTWKGKPAILDWKTSSSADGEKLDDYFTQLSAYAECVPGIKYLVVVCLSPRSELGFLPPIVTGKVKGYFKKFLKKRENFKALYNI